MFFFVYQHLYFMASALASHCSGLCFYGIIFHHYIECINNLARVATFFTVLYLNAVCIKVTALVQRAGWMHLKLSH